MLWRHHFTLSNKIMQKHEFRNEEEKVNEVEKDGFEVQIAGIIYK